MTDAASRNEDVVLPFQLDAADVRGRAARLDGTLVRMLEGHDYPPVVAGLAAEIALITALMGQAMKLRWRLSLQVRGDGPIRLLATDWFAPTKEGEPATIRAYAGYDPERLDLLAPAYPQIGRGIFGMIIDQGMGMQPYQGMTPLSGQSLADCAETYFAQSEQIATRIIVTMSEVETPEAGRTWRGGGVMLQQMPKPGMSKRAPAEGGSGEGGLLSSADVAAMGGEDHAEKWNRVNMLLDTVEQSELLGPEVTMETLLLRLFHEETPRVWDKQPVAFGCTCSADKVVAALHQYSAKDIGHMTNDEGKLTADCQFCGKHYEFDPKTLGFQAEERPEENGDPQG
ncbi:Hsp33 family molecular chaperone HslO [Rhodovulum sp. DZ06]|uniref:Hsp33 family molecular chaperone HslO n=1 Tax=Rhodovulum sp. DZ06 TaxID=3425126 RepID=UPI003D33CB06